MDVGKRWWSAEAVCINKTEAEVPSHPRGIIGRFLQFFRNSFWLTLAILCKW
jgi:hypothetical protein